MFQYSNLEPCLEDPLSLAISVLGLRGEKERNGDNLDVTISLIKEQQAAANTIREAGRNVLSNHTDHTDHAGKYLGYANIGRKK